ncbi:MAG: hypothetical protein LBE78_13105 [Burkholderiaceae bacterium]|jgi:Mor family transcriptional regulator|nr:hypothetical protein [Burkholderiaceae bacterium]
MADIPLISHMSAKRAEMLDDVASLVQRLLKDHGISQPEAESIGNATADHLADYWGGQNFTFPRDYQRKLGMRDLAIYDKWCHGKTFDILAREHDMSERGIRKLISRVRDRLKKQRQRQQPDLLDFAPKT